MNSNKARLQVTLTDDPGDYEAVIIDVQDIRINLSADTVNGWQSLPNVRRGQYDLLRLVNDQDTMLADAEIPTGRIHQLRLILGGDNFIRLRSGQELRLVTPSAQQSGLKLNIQQDVSGGILYKLVLDFDVARSIKKTGNNKYILKPVIRTLFDAVGGSIKGWVVPGADPTAVLAIQGPDTIASTYTGSGGGYMIRGLAAGSYDVHFLPSDPSFSDTARNGIVVTRGNITLVDTMFLQ